MRVTRSSCVRGSCGLRTQVEARRERERQREPLARVRAGPARRRAGSAPGRRCRYVRVSTSRISGDARNASSIAREKSTSKPRLHALAARVLLDLRERLDDRRRDPARRADHVPHHRRARRASPRAGTRRSSRPRARRTSRELERPDPRDVLIRRVEQVRDERVDSPIVDVRRRELLGRPRSIRARADADSCDVGIDRIDLGARSRPRGSRSSRRVHASSCRRYLTPISHLDSTRASNPRGSSLIVLRSFVPPPASALERDLGDVPAQHAAVEHAQHDVAAALDPLVGMLAPVQRDPGDALVAGRRDSRRPVATDSISNRTGASPVARFIFSVFDTNGHSASGDACRSHSNVYVWTSVRAHDRRRRMRGDQRGGAVAQPLDHGEHLGGIRGPACAHPSRGSARRARRPRARPRG